MPGKGGKARQRRGPPASLGVRSSGTRRALVFLIEAEGEGGGEASPPFAASTRQSTAEPSNPAVASSSSPPPRHLRGHQETAESRPHPDPTARGARSTTAAAAAEEEDELLPSCFLRTAASEGTAQRVRLPSPRAAARTPTDSEEEAEAEEKEFEVSGRHLRSRTRQPPWASANASDGGGSVFAAGAAGAAVTSTTASFGRLPSRCLSPLESIEQYLGTLQIWTKAGPERRCPIVVVAAAGGWALTARRRLLFSSSSSSSSSLFCSGHQSRAQMAPPAKKAQPASEHGESGRAGALLFLFRFLFLFLPPVLLSSASVVSALVVGGATPSKRRSCLGGRFFWPGSRSGGETDA